MKHNSRLFGGLLLLGGVVAIMALQSPTKAATYNPVLKTSNQHFDAQVVNQSGQKGYALFWYGPYYTKQSTKTRDDDGAKYKSRYVRVLQRKKTKTGTYAKLRLNAKTIGWMNVHGIKRVSFKTAAQGMFQQTGIKGSAALISAGESQPTLVQNGDANAAGTLKNDADSDVVYPLASLQKLMTAAMFQQLFAKKQLSPSTAVSRFYPSLTNAKNITIGQLITMTAGISGDEWLTSQPVTEATAVAHAIKNVRVTNNHNFIYSDDDYIILAGILSKVTKKSYNANLQSRIIKPLGLKDTDTVDETGTSAELPLAQSFTATGTAISPISLARLSALPGAGNVLSNPDDYLTFLRGLQNGKVLTKAQYRSLSALGAHYAGMYVWRPGVRYANGYFSGQQFQTGFYATTGNYHAAVVFANGTTKGGTALGDISKTMYEVAKYY